MFHFLFGRSSTALRQNTVLTVDWMTEQKIVLCRDLDSKLSALFSHANMIPEVGVRTTRRPERHADPQLQPGRVQRGLRDRPEV